MLKKISFAAFFLGFCLANASQISNGIAVIIENEPITVNEVRKAAAQLQTNEANALNLLIRDRLETAQIKNLKIEASDYELNQRLQKIASESGMSVSDLRSAVLSKGGDYAQFKDDVAKTIKQEKLYQSIFADAKINISENAARAYFEQNRDLFAHFTDASVTRYVASSAQLLEVARHSSPMNTNHNVHMDVLDLKSEQIPPQLRTIFQQTPDGTFTQIFQTPEGFEMFYVASKKGQTMPEFDEVRDEAMNALYKLEQDRVIGEYFNKLRAKANVKYLR
ncbi:peptidylprolyl isomerase [Campylobacter rectus]|uniref:peptidylprolyl isomerase n=1 Tax=Campylobacter rectus TaxID=203 RepID=UPI0028EAC206|nr:peptidylprolyl isomerase [Campylobacter rectus]